MGHVFFFSFLFLNFFFALFPCDRGGGSGQSPPNDGSDYNTQNHAAYYDHYLLLWSVYREGQTVVRRSRGAEENTLGQRLWLCLCASAIGAKCSREGLKWFSWFGGGGIWSPPLLHSDAHGCKTRPIISSSKPACVPDVENDAFKPVSRAKKSKLGEFLRD